MKRLAMVLVLTVASIGFSNDYATTLEGASEAAEKTGKHILLVHTGPSWCVHCRQLDAQIFNDDEAYAKVREHFVVLYVELHRGKGAQDLNRATQGLRTKYPPTGYPTIHLIDPSAVSYKKFSGYTTGRQNILLERIFAAKTQRNIAIESMRMSQMKVIALLGKLDGEPDLSVRQALMSNADQLIPEDSSLDLFFQATFSKMAEADPKDELGFRSKHRALAAYAELHTFDHPEDPVRVLTLTDTVLETALADEMKHRVLIWRATAYRATEQIGALYQTLAEIKPLDSDPQLIQALMDILAKQLGLRDT